MLQYCKILEGKYLQEVSQSLTFFKTNHLHILYFISERKIDLE